METEKLTLTKADVQKLMADPSAVVRAETTGKIAAQYERNWPKLTDAERKIAEDIFRALTNDVEVSVRRALSMHLKSAADLPGDVALSLADDVDEVALPMIKASDVLSDDDLIEIVRKDSVAKQVAVAQRETVSERVADAVIETGNETAVARLVANEGATLTESQYDRVIDQYEESGSVSDSLCRRPKLPPAISEKLIQAVSHKLEKYLVDERELLPDQASDIIHQARERAIVTLLPEGSSDEDLMRLIRQLQKHGRLTSSLVLRSLCMGDLAFFEAVVARLAQIPVRNARILIHDKGHLGLDSVYSKAGLPERFLPAVRAAIMLHHETEYDGEPYDRERFTAKMIERMLTLFEDPGSKIKQEDIDYLLGKLEDLAA